MRANLKKAFSTPSKDISQVVVSLSEFGKNYQYIIGHLHRDIQTKYMSLEICLMMVRFCLANNLRQEALNFITDSIYITNLQIEETAKVNNYKKRF